MSLSMSRIPQSGLPGRGARGTTVAGGDRAGVPKIGIAHIDRGDALLLGEVTNAGAVHEAARVAGGPAAGGVRDPPRGIPHPAHSVRNLRSVAGAHVTAKAIQLLDNFCDRHSLADNRINVESDIQRCAPRSVSLASGGWFGNTGIGLLW